MDPQVPLHPDPLRLAAEPRSVQTARQWIYEQFSELGRHDLIECAELGISELVTNALLHGQAPIAVRLRGTKEHPRIEVTDGSSRPPVLTGPPDELDDLLATFGRGMGIVARSSTAWGAAIERIGKVVWFEPSPQASDGSPPAGEFFDAPPARRTSPEQREGMLALHLLGLPVATTMGLQRHHEELRREARLLSFAHDEDYPLAGELTDIFIRLERVLPLALTDAVDAAAASGQEILDLDVEVSGEAAPVFEEFLALMDRADDFCRAERLLSLARSPHQKRFQRWILGELIGQSSGQAPVRWSGRPGDTNQ